MIQEYPEARGSATQAAPRVAEGSHTGGSPLRRGYERDMAIGRAYDAGDDLQDIAEHFGMTRPSIITALVRIGKRRRVKLRRRVQHYFRPNDVGMPIEFTRVDRDPCPRCGIRRDIGCAHTRAEQ
jgi:hypothetical protein